MGTIVVIDVYATADGAAGRASQEISGQLAEAVATLHRADEIFSTWKPDSPVSRLRRGELSSAQAPAEVAKIIDRCAVARDLSGGWFDPWAVPGGFDPSGYVKGWAAQNALAAFRSSGICGVLVNAAGDIASSGGLGDGTPFRIGIADPLAPLRLAEIVELTGAIATSGTYERGEHLIDPRSGRPAARAASASVTGPDLGLADALATALAVAGEPGLALIDGLDGYEALVINPDGSKQRTKRFPVAAARVHQPFAGAPPRAWRLPGACAGHDAGFRDDRLEAHVSEAGVAQRQLPELWCGRVLVADAQSVPGEVLGDAPPPGRPPDGERRRLCAEYLPVTPGRAAAEHHVGDHDAAPGAQPPCCLGGQRPLVLVPEVVQRVTGHDQIDAGRRHLKGPQVCHLGPDVA